MNNKHRDTLHPSGLNRATRRRVQKLLRSKAELLDPAMEKWQEWAKGAKP